MKVRNLLSQILLAGFVLSFAGNAVAEDKKLETDAPKNVAITQPGTEKKISAEELYKISSDDIVLGDSKAKVTIIEYASMTCPHCADFHKNTYPELKTKYIDTGKVKFVFRPFPLDEAALRASMLASCAGKDRFYKFIDVIFSTQSTWAPSKNYLEVLSNIGKLGGFSGDDFDKCMVNHDLEKKIMQGKFDATTVLNIRSTPSFFINGSPYKGAHGFEYFSKVVEDALGEKPAETSDKPAPVPNEKPVTPTEK